MMRLMRAAIGVVFLVIGLLMLIVVFRQGGMDASQTMIGPLALMGAGALAISSSRKRKP